MATAGKKLDLNQLAKSILDQATGEAPRVSAARKAAASKGGTKRMSGLSEEERLKLSAAGVAARKKTPAKVAGVVEVKKRNAS